MIVDDHTLIRETWSSLLSTVPNLEIVAECGDGRLAIEMAKNIRPNIVLLDINMEPVNGFEVLKMIRKFSPASKIIGLSMRSEPAYAKKLLRLGAKGYVTKNSARSEMLEAINEVSNGKIFVCQEVKKLLSEITVKDNSKAQGINSLSDRELQVLGLLSAGESSKEIAAALGIAVKTIEVHRHNILSKLNLKNMLSLKNYIDSHAVDL
ncbi:MAG TPA: response regulator transcription factor [Puia sp.]|jgi:DNA-binding NarL/FixJ family response regulator|nr:response regulator transcription factor [Puia sp.]